MTQKFFFRLLKKHSMSDALLPIEGDTSRVSFAIIVNGEEMPSSIPVLSVVVQNEVNRIPVAYISVADGDPSAGDWMVSNDAWFVPGNEIEILAGYHGVNESIFKGIITRHSLYVRQQRRELNIECRDKAILMTTVRNSTLFSDVKDSDIAATLLQAYELDGVLEDTPVTHEEIIQYDSTDWDFLISRIESVGFVSIAKEGKIDIQKPVVESVGLATLRFGANILEFDGEIDGCKQYGTVKAQAWDPSAQELLEVESNDPGWTTLGNFSPTDISATTGAAAYTLRQPGSIKEEEVQQWADAKLLRSRMAFMCGRARVEGFSKALPGITVGLEGFGTRFNGMGWVSGVRHELARGNWLVDLQIGLTQQLHTEKFATQTAEASALLPGIHGLHTAIVTALEGDPDSEGRIRIKIPSVGLDGEGNWARLSTLTAGASRGSVFRPDIDDEVVVGFLNNDPRQPVVLGALHSSAKASPVEATDDNYLKGFTTSSGMHIMFDDEKKTITIDTPSGNSLTLDEDQKQIQIADQNGNTIILSGDGITLDSAKDIVLKAKQNIKMESSMAFESKAGTQFKAEGSAGIEISSSAIATIKGSLVQIN
jgi:Rhs element Vgr protein